LTPRSNVPSDQYLRNLLETGQIHQLVSEPDFCQAHATNKGLLRARGELIKIITAAAAFSFPAMLKGRNFMLAHPDLDVLVGNVSDLSPDESGNPVLRPRNEHEQYRRWRNGDIHSFWFGDQGIFLRRIGLPLIGLFHTDVVCIDVEQLVRLTALKQARIGWTNALMSITVVNADSNGLRHRDRMLKDFRRLFEFYGPSRASDIKQASAGALIREAGRRFERKLRFGVRALLPFARNRRPELPFNTLHRPFAECFEVASDLLREASQRRPNYYLPQSEAGRRLLA
jgi:hypothetical protein